MKTWFTSLDRHNRDAYKLDKAIEMSGREDVLALSVADSDYETAPAIKEALLDRTDHGAFGYSGIPKDFAPIIKAWFKRRYNFSIKPHWVVPAPKVLNALCVLMQTLSNPKDKVLIQPPVYHVFKPAILENNRVVVENELIKTKEGYRIDFGDFEAKLKEGVKLFMLCSPHNPVGRVYTDAELKRMVQLCKAYDVTILSDEIHADLIMENHHFISMAHYHDLYEKIIVISAPSKTFNIAGLQVAYMVIPNNEIRKHVKKTYNALHLSGPNLLAYTALKAAYTKSDDWVDAQNKHIKINYNHLKAFIEAHSDKAWIAPLEGTYLAWIDMHFTGLNSETIIDGLTTQGLVVSDGKTFSEHTDTFIRVNLACSEANMLLAIQRLKTYLETL